MGAVFVQYGHGGGRTHVDDNQRWLILPQGGHVRHYQVRAHLARILQQNVQPGFQSRTHHQRRLAGELFDGGLEGIEHLGHHRGNDGAVDPAGGNMVDLQQDFQIHAVLVRSFGGLRPEPGLKDDVLPGHAAKYNIGISDINRQNHD